MKDSALFSSRTFHSPRAGGCELEIYSDNNDNNSPVLRVKGGQCPESRSFHTAQSPLTTEGVLTNRAAFIAAHGGALACNVLTGKHIEERAPDLYAALQEEQLRIELAAASLDKVLTEVAQSLPIPVSAGE
jgi:hypothetical protein